jgi:hypothetical protein
MLTIDHVYHVVELNTHAIPKDVVAWLNSQYGVNTDRYFHKNGKIYFLNKHDHFLFLLRWG